MEFPVYIHSFHLLNRTYEIAVPDALSVQTAYENGSIIFPYWSQVWPAAIALSDFLLRYPHYIAQKIVLELSAGLGLPSIVAARSAVSVICSDYIPEAITVIQQSIQHHSLQNVQARLLNWHTLPEDMTCDVLLLSDVSYNPALFPVQEKLMRKFLQTGTTIIISTPQRLMARQAIEPLLNFCVKQEEKMVEHKGKELPITLLVLKK